MATVVVDIQATKKDFPAGTVSGGFLVQIINAGTQGSIAQQIVQAPYTATFTGIAFGSYFARVFGTDEGHGVITAAVDSAGFAVVDSRPPASIDVPQTVTVTVS